MTAKILLVALDAADYRLVRYCINHGGLPNLSVLLEAGKVHRLATLSGLTDDAMWASFQYGTGIGEHGRYHWQRDSEDQNSYIYDAVGESELTAWWEPLAEAGYKVAIFDIPKAKLTEPKGGLHFTDWLVHGRYGQDVKSWPPEIAGEVLSRFGNLQLSYCRLSPEQADGVETENIVCSLLESVALKTAAATHFLGQSNWDIFATSFKELHCLSHLRSTEPVLDHGDTAAFLPFQKICTAIDEAIGQLLAVAGDQCIPIIFSTTGMAANKSIEHLAPALVDRINQSLEPPKGIGKYFGWKRKPIVKILPYNEDSVALRIRAKSKREKQQWTERVEELLTGLKDGTTGNPIILRCHRLSAVHPGPRADRLPDILGILTASAGQPTELVSKDLGVIRESPNTIRPGNHSGNGFLVVPPSVFVAHASGHYAMEDIGALVTQTLNRLSGKP